MSKIARFSRGGASPKPGLTAPSDAGPKTRLRYGLRPPQVRPDQSPVKESDLNKQVDPGIRDRSPRPPPEPSASAQTAEPPDDDAREDNSSAPAGETGPARGTCSSDRRSNSLPLPSDHKGKGAKSRLLATVRHRPSSTRASSEDRSVVQAEQVAREVVSKPLALRGICDSGLAETPDSMSDLDSPSGSAPVLINKDQSSTDTCDSTVIKASKEGALSHLKSTSSDSKDPIVSDEGSNESITGSSKSKVNRLMESVDEGIGITTDEDAGLSEVGVTESESECPSEDMTSSVHDAPKAAYDIKEHIKVNR